MKKFLLAATLAFWAGGTVHAGSVVYNQNLANETALAVDTNYSLDLGNSNLRNSNIDSISAAATVAQAAPTAVTFTDGVASTATITVSSMTALHGVTASATLTVAVSTTVLSSLSPAASFTLNGYKFTKGDLWLVGASTGATGQNIVNAINSYPPTSSRFLATTSSNSAPGVVTITVISSGTAGNNYTLLTSSSAALQVNASTSAVALPFKGGINNGLLMFNINGSGVVLTEGTDWQAVTSSQATITSIKAAIDGNATLSALVSVSTATGAKANLTSKGVGIATNFGIIVSSPNALGITNNRMYGGTDSAVNTTANKITAAAHTLTTGLPVLFAKTAGTAPGLLVTGTTYYAIRTDANSFKLASSTTNAVAGTAVSVATQTATGGGSFTVTPLAYSGKANTGFKWQASNDNANWADLSVSSVTYSSPSTTASTTFWDFGSVNYRYLRLRVISPTQGGVSLTVPVVGRSNN